MSTARRTRFFFFLSPYARMAFTRCPKCQAKTKQRKLPIVIHIEPETICVLNKTCRFCQGCQLVIARQSEIEPILRKVVNDDPGVIERGEYVVIGTLDREDWQAGHSKPWSAPEAVDRAWVFEDCWNFVVRGGWGPAEDASVP
jgi:hypothetical protein